MTGWINGFSCAGIVISGCVLGIFFIYKSKRTNAKLLFYMGLAAIFGGLTWLGGLVDFLNILFTGNNMNNPYGLHGILGYMWAPPTYVIIIYIGVELLMAEKRRLKVTIISFYLVLAIIFEILLFFDALNSLEFVYPSTSGEDLIDNYPNLNSTVGIILFINIFSVIILWGFGFIVKAYQSTGVVKKKFLTLSVTTFLIFFFTIIDNLTSFGIILIFARIGVICCYILYYYGLREEPEKKEKLKPKKEVKVKESLFRITKRPAQITEEEVSISKEKKICLVCKGKVGRYMFMCPECESFYCEKCAHALEELENACWACGESIDETRPVKPFKKEEVDIEISEKSQKKPKTKK